MCPPNTRDPGLWGGRKLPPELRETSLRESAHGALMAERILRRTLATVSLSVALASVTVKSSGCRNIPECRYSPLLVLTAPETVGCVGNLLLGQRIL